VALPYDLAGGRHALLLAAAAGLPAGPGAAWFLATGLRGRPAGFMGASAQSSRGGVSMWRMERPFTRKMTISAMFVA
jgi:hypothetical protein